MSLAELLLIFIVALVVFGPDKLPELAYRLGKMAQWLKTNKAKWSHEINKQLKIEELQLRENEKKAADADKAYQKEKS